MALSYTQSTMFLSFLRPLALPRVSTLHRFLSTSSQPKDSSNSVPLRTDPANTTTGHLHPVQPASKSPNSVLPYRVERTPSSNLPIYLLAKRGGNLKQTKLRKIEGDINTLRLQLRDALKLEDKEIVINQLTKQIIIRVSSISSTDRSGEDHMKDCC